MATHTVLAQVHLLDQIFGYFSDLPNLMCPTQPRNNDLKINIATLRNAALTCRKFAEPASCVLWSALYGKFSLMPLLSTLSNFKPRTRARNTFPVYYLDGAIPPSEWARFQTLARRVRYLVYSDIDNVPGVLNASVPNLLVTQCGNEPLLPNLQMLVWTRSGRRLEQQRLLNAFCRAPRFTILQFTAPSCHELPRACGGRPSSVTDLDVVASVHNGLRKLEIELSALYGAEDIPSELYQSMTQLREVKAPLTQASHLRGLGMLPFLERLSVYVEPPFDDPSTTTTAPFPGFTMLRELEVGGSTPHALMRIISTISSPHLFSVRFHVVAALPQDVTSVIELLSSLPCAQRLQTVRIYLSAHVTPNNFEEDMLLPFHPLANSLFRLAQLEDLSIVASGHVWSVSDDDMRAARGAWPALRRLSLGSHATSTMMRRHHPAGLPAARPHLSTLVALAQSCPALEVLAVDSHDVLPDELEQLEARAAAAPLHAVPDGAAPQLRYLVPAQSNYACERLQLCDVSRLARALHALFPQLRGVERERGDDGRAPYVGEWWEVDRSTDGFRLLVALRELAEGAQMHVVATSGDPDFERYG